MGLIPGVRQNVLMKLKKAPVTGAFSIDSGWLLLSFSLVSITFNHEYAVFHFLDLLYPVEMFYF